jgi:signal transduction histidine kinase
MFNSHSLTFKLVVGFLAMSLIPLLVVFITESFMYEELRSEFHNSLSEQFDEKAFSVNSSLEQRIFEIDVMSHDILFQELLTDLSHVDVENIHELLSTRYSDYAFRTGYIDTILEIKIFDNDGVELFSLYGTHLGSEYDVESFNKVNSPTVVFDSSEEFGAIVNSISPIMSDDNSKKLGMLLLVTDMQNFEPIFMDRSGLKETGEAYLVNLEKIMLSESRFIEDAQFSQTVDTFAVQQCLENNSDVNGEIYLDYRGEEIIGYSKCMIDNGAIFIVEADLQELNSSLNVFQNGFFALFLTTIFVFLIFSFYVGRKIAKPIIQLNKFANEITLGNFDSKIEVKENDEIGQLAHVMSNMGKKLNEQIIQLEKTNHLLERMSVIGELTGRLVHDLRNPLSVIKIENDVAKMRIDDADEKTRQRSKRIEDSIESISNIIKDVLDYVKKGKLSFKEVLISDVISEAIDLIHVPDKIKINLNLKEIKINADEMKLSLVFSNIISNAIESIGETGEITIRVDDVGDKIRIDFEDSGPGIDIEIIDKVFDPLFTTKSTGTGLGLITCKKIIEEHAGEIKVENNPTTFIVILPKDANSYSLKS